MPLTLPNAPPVPGLKAKASQVTGWLAAIIAKFAGGIVSADLSPTAGVTGGQISQAAGTRITNTNLENQAVDNRTLRSDIAAGRPNAAVKRDNIVDGEVLTAHLAASAVVAGKVSVGTHSQALPSVSLGQGQATVFAPAPALPVGLIPIFLKMQNPTPGAPSANVGIELKVVSDSGGAIYFVALNAGTVTVNPSGSTLKFTYILAT